MATLFDSARAVIEDLDQLKADPETADDGLDFNPQLPSELAQLSQIAKAELTSTLLIDLDHSDSGTLSCW